MDQDDHILDILVQSWRNKKAAKKFFRKLLKGLRYVPRVVITDKLKSYGAAKREMLPGVEHRQSGYLNNPTASLNLAFCLSSLSVRQIGTVMAPLHPRNQPQDVVNRRYPQR